MAQLTFFVYGEIGTEVHSESIVQQLSQVPDKSVLVRINSGGGSIHDGNAIFNALRQHRGGVRVMIDGVAASAASFIAMAGDQIEMAENALLMIHNPFMGSGGTAEDLRRGAELLDRIAANMLAAYASKTGMDRNTVNSMMAAETWFTAEEAKEAGFIDEITAELDVAASVDPHRFRSAPAHIRERLQTMAARTIRAGQNLAAELERLIEAQTTEQRSRQAIQEAMAEAAGIDPSTVDSILSGDINCPPRGRLQGFAEVLNTNTASLVSAAEGDGCDYSNEGDNMSNDNATGSKSSNRPQAAADPQSVAAERNRVNEILKKCRVANVPQSFADDLISGGYSPQAAADAILARMHEQSSAVEIDNHVRPVPSHPQDDDFHAAARDGILMRYGIQVPNPHPAAVDFQGASAKDLAAKCLSRAGKTVEGHGADKTIKAALTTSDFPQLIEQTAQKAMIRGLEEEGIASHRGTWTRNGSVQDFKEAARVSLSEAPGLEKVVEGAEITRGAMGDAGETIQAETYARIVSITRNALINDDLGELTRVPQAMGMAASRTETDKVYRLLADNPTMRDGEQLFSTAHNNVASSASAITVDALAEARAALRKQRGPEGLSYLNVVPQFLIVGADRETEALQVLSQIEPNQASDAIPEWIRRLTLVVDPRIDDFASGAWFLAGNPNSHDTFEVAFLDGQQAPKLEQQEDFDTLTMSWRVVFDFGVAALDWRALFKNPGA
jgi:ATP-dependent Clp endopeptidase proteolytic subunit ClpP